MLVGEELTKLKDELSVVKMKWLDSRRKILQLVQLLVSC